MNELTPKALSNRIDRLKLDLKTVAKEVCALESAAGLSEQEVELIISEAPVNSSTQSLIDSIQDQLDQIGSGNGGPETDPVFNASAASGITNTIIDTWNAASANSHTHANKTTLDSITNALITSWNNAASWGNHASAGYLNSSSNIPQANITNLTTDLSTKAPINNPTLTGNVNLPNTTTIGNISATELGYLDGVTSSVQTQLTGKEPVITPGTTAQYWRGDKTWQTLPSGGGASDASALTYSNGETGAIARSTQSRLAEELWVEDFRAGGDTDADVWDKAIAAMQLKKIPLRVGNRAYTFTRTVIVGGDYFRVIGTEGDYTSGTRININIAGAGNITNTVAPSTTIPTTSNPGHLSGGAFYFTSLIYYSQIENISFNGGRFGLVFLQSHNSPTIKGCYFYNCNVGVIAYQGCQNYQYINCSDAGCNVFHISSATAFPSGSTYAGQDNYYTDGLSFKNEGSYGSFGGHAINNFFDTWFVGSILRPSLDSVSVGGTIKYLDSNNTVYADNSVYSTPSGRVAFVPMRNGRPSFGAQFTNVDVRGDTPRGFILINNAVAGVQFIGPVQFEAMFNSGNTTTSYFTFGSIIDANVLSPYYNHSSYNNPNPLFSLTNRGNNPGFSEGLDRINMVSNQVGNTIVKPWGGDYMYFTGNKDIIINWTQNSNQVLKAFTDGNTIGRKITFNVIGSGNHTLSFDPAVYKISNGTFDTTKTNVIEMTWMGSYADVKIFNQATGGSATTDASLLTSGTLNNARLSAQVMTTTKYKIFNVMDYGAVGDDVADDTVAFQNTINAARIVAGKVLIPSPPVAYRITDTLNIIPILSGQPGYIAGNEVYLDIEGHGRPETHIRYYGAANKAVFYMRGWRFGSCTGLKVRVVDGTGANEGIREVVRQNVNVFDLDTDTPSFSTTHITFKDCHIFLGNGLNTVGWRLGHISGGGADISDIQWENCSVWGSYMNTKAGSCGWLIEGANTLQNNWFGGFGAFLDRMFSNKDRAGAGNGPGNGGCYFFGLGSSHNNVEYEIHNRQSYLISGGRYEVGKHFMVVTNSSDAPNIVVQGVEINDFEPNTGDSYDQALFWIDRPCSLILQGVNIFGQAAYTNKMITLYGGGGGTNTGTLEVVGGTLEAADPFFFKGNSTPWRVYVRGVGNTDRTVMMKDRHPYIAPNGTQYHLKIDNAGVVTSELA